MDRNQIAAILSEMAELLQLKGENPFKVRAYENAARAMETLPDDLGTLVARGQLTTIPGIGKNLADHIAELLQTGTLTEYEALKKSIPTGVIEMLGIPGLGPKRVRYLWEERKIRSIGELEMTATRHLLANFPGFGQKMEEKILAGIESIKRFAGKRLYAEAAIEAAAIHEEVRRWPEVIRTEIGGSIRRCKEIIADIDLLVSTKNPKRVMERFVALSRAERVLQHGETKSEVVLTSGIQCDLRAVEDLQYPFALHYFTGSKEHNVAMRTRSKKSGIKMNEYGLFRGASKKTIACRDEAAVFGALGLAFIEPELRENMGEIEAAGEGRLPKLIERRDLKGVMHAHTTHTDGTASIAEMAEATKRRDYSYLLVTDHSQAVTVAQGLKPRAVPFQHQEIDALNEKRKGFRVLKGIEVDILADGSLDFDDELLATFDIVIAAIHSRFGMPEKEMTARIIRAISNPNVDILAHPTGRLLLAREPYAVDLGAVIDAAAAHGAAIEINAHPQRLDLDWRWCKVAKERGVKLAICPDAHSPEGLDDIVYGINVARKGWLEKANVLNCLSADQLVAHFRR